MKKKSFYVVLLCVMCFIMSLGLSVPAMAAGKPSRPKIVSVRQTAPRAVTIRWKKAKNAKQYALFVSVNGSGFAKLTKMKGRSYTHTGVTPGNIYTYKLKAVNGSKKSGFSNPKSIAIPKTTADYYDDLQAIILNSPIRTKGGDPAIAGTLRAPTYYYEYSIIYKPGTDTFSFFMYIVGTNFNAFLDLSVNRNAINNGRAPGDFSVYYVSGDSMQMYTTIQMASYYKNQYLSWQGTGSQDLANEGLSVAFSLWDNLLKKQTNLTLQNLGFTSYVA